MTKSSFNTGHLDGPPGREGQKVKKGKLTIFLGVTPGVGKASAMLRAAQSESANGRQVVAGIVTWYTRPETMALMGGLMVIPPKNVRYKDVVHKEMDTEAILNMHPDIVLMTNPAHINASGSRHLKRYQDIQEMLDSGIDVYTTLNMAQLESYSDFIYEVTGCTVSTVPDEFFAQADDVELVDIDPDKLVKRYKDGKVFISEFSDKAIETIYQKEKIEILRKKFFQMTIDRENWQKQHASWPSKIRSRLLITIWPDAITPYVIRRAKALSTIIDTDWVALYIDSNRELSDREKTQLDDNIKLTRQLGGTLITYVGNDPLEAIIEVSHRERISHIVLGKTPRGRTAGYSEKNFLKRLLKYSGHINVSIVCGETVTDENKKLVNTRWPISGIGMKALTVVFALVTGLLCTMLNAKTVADAPPYIVMLLLFILAALLRTSQKVIIITLLLLAVATFVLPPSFTFLVNFPSDIKHFLFFCFFSLLIGILTLRIRIRDNEVFTREKQTNALFLLTKRLAEASEVREVVETSTENLLRYFNVHVFFIFRDDDCQLTNFEYLPKGLTLSEKEIETATWAFKHDRPAGRYTRVMSMGEYSYYPLIGTGVKIGVLGAKLETPFGGKDNISWDAFLAQIAQSIEHQYLEMIAHRTNLLNESDKLYKTLFNSISHELRIPISTIIGASDILLASPYSEQVRVELYGEILDASRRLNRLVENLLNMSRLESGRIAVRFDWCDIHDLFNRVAENLEDDLRLFHFEMVVPETMPLVRIDYGLMEQVVYNLVYNSTLYAPEGTTIRLSTCYDNGFLIIQVTDRGPGFEPNALAHVFNKFWRPPGEKPGGLGLGLSIVKGFVEAHQGTVFVANRKNGGAHFTVMILTEKSSEDEHKTVKENE